MRLNPSFSLWFGVLFALGGGVVHAESEAIVPASNQVLNAPDEDAERLLKRMASAMQTTNYEGLLLHMRGGEARSMRVFHRYDAEQGEREHLLSLDGKPFEVIQDSQGCICVWPQSRFIVIGQAPAFNGRLSAERFAETRSLSAFYTIARQDYARVGGIACRLVKLEPTDAYRFAYRLCIHEPSAMLLNLEVFDGERRLELSQFTQLRVQKNKDADDMRIFTNTEGFRVVEDKRPVSTEPTQAAFQTSWVATQLPPGYRLRSADLRNSPHTQKPLEQLIFSDGLGSVSVFIERVDAASQSSVVETAKAHPRGVMGRVVRDVDGFRLTAVGDAPEIAMRMMLDGMQPSSPRVKE
jgi:sigma-E factor negative regulatory protein RseB